MMPKISVSPAASMNSSRPYCTPLSNWMRKLAMSISLSRVRNKKMGGRDLPLWRDEPSAHLAAGTRIGQSLRGHPDHLVFLVFDHAQVDVLYRVVRLAHGPL